MIKDLSIIFPSYNEEKRLKNTFKQILKFKKKLKKRRLEVIFVDDGSCDNSQNLINNFRENQKKKGLTVQSILFEKNIGKGFALKKGIQKCTMKWVLTSDVDLSVPLDQVLKWEDSMLIKSCVPSFHEYCFFAVTFFAKSNPFRPGKSNSKAFA